MTSDKVYGIVNITGDGISQLQIIFITADLNVKVKTLAHTMIKNSNNYICINTLVPN